MKILRKKLPVELNFFGKPKAFDAQSFDTKLAEFRDEAYASIPENHNFLRARCLIDSGIDATRTLLKNIWDTPEKFDMVNKTVNGDFIDIYLQVDNNYTAYEVKVRLCGGFYWTRYESSKSSNFDEVLRTEKDEMFKKYGFSAIPPKQYRVKFEHHEAVLSRQELDELYKEYPDFYFKVQEDKDRND